MQIAARLIDGLDFLRLQHSAALVPVRITVTAPRRRTQKPGASTAFVSSAR